MLYPDALVTVNFTHLSFFVEDVVRSRDLFGVRACALPMLPSLKDSVPDFTLSFRFGRSFRTIPLIATEIGRASCRERVESSAVVAHSRVKSPGQPSITWSMALLPNCPAEVFCEETVILAVP